MVYTVTFNPALDYVLNVKNLQSKDINRTEAEQLFYGGKGINVSVILTRLGIENEALGFVGGFSGKQLNTMLQADGIHTDFVCLKNGITRINVKIKSEQDFDINANGPEISHDELEQLFEKLNKIKRDDFLVLAGSIPPSMNNDIYEKILEKLSTKGIHFIVDATGDLLLNVLKFKPLLIKPNHHELAELFSADINNLDDIKTYAARLQNMGAENVLVSRGKDGAALLDKDARLHISKNVPGEIKSAVGCGDSMVAGFIAGFIKTGSFEYALKLGSACGNATAFSDTLATKEEIHKILQSEYFK